MGASTSTEHTKREQDRTEWNGMPPLGSSISAEVVIDVILKNRTNLKRVRSSALAYLRNAGMTSASGDDAEDALSDFVRKVLPGVVRAVKDSKVFWPYFARSLRNHCKAFAKKVRRQPKFYPLDGVTAPTSALAAVAVGRHNDDEQRAHRNASLEALEAAIARLPERLRTVAQLRREGMKEADIANRLDTTEGNVKVMVHRAKRRLRQDAGLVWQVQEGLSSSQIADWKGLCRNLEKIPAPLSDDVSAILNAGTERLLTSAEKERLMAFINAVLADAALLPQLELTSTSRKRKRAPMQADPAQLTFTTVLDALTPRLQSK